MEWNDGPPAKFERGMEVETKNGCFLVLDTFPNGLSAYTEACIIHIADVLRWRWPGPAQPRSESDEEALKRLHNSLAWFEDMIRLDERAKLEAVHKARLREEADKAWNAGTARTQWLVDGRGQEPTNWPDYLRSRGL